MEKINKSLVMQLCWFQVETLMYLSIYIFLNILYQFYTYFNIYIYIFDFIFVPRKHVTKPLLTGVHMFHLNSISLLGSRELKRSSEINSEINGEGNVYFFSTYVRKVLTDGTRKTKMTWGKTTACVTVWQKLFLHR